MKPNRASGDFGSRRSRIVRWSRIAGRRLRSLFSIGRVLQLEEIRVGVSEHLDTQSLAGLRTTFLPSRVGIRVSEEDLQYLRPFEEAIEATVREEAGRRLAKGDWRATADRINVRLRSDPAMKAGAPPRLSSSYPPGVRVATWRPQRGSDGSLATGDGVGDPSMTHRVTLTSAIGDGTAIQEEIVVHLGPVLSLAEIDPGTPNEGTTSLSVQADIIVDEAGNEWSPPESIKAGIRMPSDTGHPDSEESDRQTLAFCVDIHVNDGPRWLWCPGGQLVVGRSDEHAHLAPRQAPPSLSRRQFQIDHGADGSLRVLDLGSMNGTWLGTRKLNHADSYVVEKPATIQVGEKGRFAMEIA